MTITNISQRHCVSLAITVRSLALNSPVLQSQFTVHSCSSVFILFSFQEETHLIQAAL